MNRVRPTAISIFLSSILCTSLSAQAGVLPLRLNKSAQTLLRYFDPHQILSHYLKTHTAEFTAYRNFARDKENRLLKRLLKTAKQAPPQHPLEGLRIALDPGHISRPDWDSRTGKYVKLLDGRKLSEGTLNMQLALLLADELSKMGAEVLVTTNNMQPPRSAWQGKHFNKAADLTSRAKTINHFKPQLTLILHFDAHDTNRLQSRVDHTRAYVYGNLGAHELSSRKNLSLALRNLAESQRWVESNVFSAAVVKNLADAAKLDLKTEPTDIGGMKIANGVYARNLYLPKLINEGAVCYLEVFNYSYQKEFERLMKLDRSANLFGFKFNYSSRLDEVVNGIKAGILDYVDSIK